MLPKNSYNFTTLMKIGMTNFIALAMVCGTLSIAEAQVGDSLPKPIHSGGACK